MINASWTPFQPLVAAAAIVTSAMICGTNFRMNETHKMDRRFESVDRNCERCSLKA
jgi:hypothetical protein